MMALLSTVLAAFNSLPSPMDGPFGKSRVVMKMVRVLMQRCPLQRNWMAVD